MFTFTVSIRPSHEKWMIQNLRFNRRIRYIYSKQKISFMPSSIFLSSLRISCCFISFLPFGNVDQVDIHLKKNKSASVLLSHHIIFIIARTLLNHFYMHCLQSHYTKNIKIWDKIKSKRMWPLKGRMKHILNMSKREKKYVVLFTYQPSMLEDEGFLDMAPCWRSLMLPWDKIRRNLSTC